MTCTATICLLTMALAAVDGDGFKSATQAYRVFGVDAPEMDERSGPGAKRAMSVLLREAKGLACEPHGRSYNRKVVRCHIIGGPNDGDDLACVLVSLGWAEDWPRYSGGIYRGC